MNLPRTLISTIFTDTMNDKYENDCRQCFGKRPHTRERRVRAGIPPRGTSGSSFDSATLRYVTALRSSSWKLLGARSCYLTNYAGVVALQMLPRGSSLRVDVAWLPALAGPVRSGRWRFGARNRERFSQVRISPDSKIRDFRSASLRPPSSRAPSCASDRLSMYPRIQCGR